MSQKAGAAAGGALAGAGTGAAIGSVVPGIGTAIGAAGGAIIGGLAGFFGSGSGGSKVPPYSFSRGDYQLGTPSRASRTVLGTDDLQFRNDQVSLGQALQKRAMGTSPSVVDSQIANARDQNLRGSLALAASRRGFNPSAQRNVLGGMSEFNQNLVSQGVPLRLQEQAAAEQSYGQFLANVRGQDIAKAQSQAQLDQAINLFNTGQINEFQLQQVQNNIRRQELESNYLMGKGTLDTGVAQNNKDYNRKLLAGGINAGASVLGSIGSQGLGGSGGSSGGAIPGSAGSTARFT